MTAVVHHGLDRGGPTSKSGRRRLRPFAVPLAAAVAASLIFAVLLIQVLVVGPVLWIDRALQATVAGHRDPLGVEMASAISRITAFPIEVIVGLLVALLFTLRARSATPWVLAAVGMLALLSVPAIKELVDRVRPPSGVRAMVAEDLGSNAAFPSGHAATSAVFAGLVYLLVAPYLAGLGRRLLGVTAIGYVAAVGASRVYLGVHWLTDVLAGWALGTVIVAGLAVLAYRGRPVRPGTR